jgi:hypothetical protein
MKAYWEWRYSSTHSLTLALDGELSASRSSLFTPKERDPGTHWVGGWVGTRADLEVAVKRKIPSPRRESNPRTPIVQPVAQSLYRLSYLLPCNDKRCSHLRSLPRIHLHKDTTAGLHPQYTAHVSNALCISHSARTDGLNKRSTLRVQEIKLNAHTFKAYISQVNVPSSIYGRFSSS